MAQTGASHFFTMPSPAWQAIARLVLIIIFHREVDPASMALPADPKKNGTESALQRNAAPPVKHHFAPKKEASSQLVR
ncbi:MAG: hypothetical protein V4457_05565 [Pseudomonadota bacterium]